MRTMHLIGLKPLINYHKFTKMQELPIKPSEIAQS